MAENLKNFITNFDRLGDATTLRLRWKRWLTAFELIADRKGLILVPDKDDNKRRKALLLHLARSKVQHIFSTLPDTGINTEYDKAVTIKQALNEYFAPNVNTAYASHSFRKLAKNAGETVRHFVTRLKQAARDCDYGTDTGNQIRDKVLCKCTSAYVRRKLLEEEQILTLTRTLEIAVQCEKVEAQMVAFSHETDETIKVGSGNDPGGNLRRKRVVGEQRPITSGELCIHETTNIKCRTNANSSCKELHSYATDKPLPVKGTFPCEVPAGSKKTQAECIMIKGKGASLFGKETAIKLGVLAVGIGVAAVANTNPALNLTEQYPAEVIYGIGKFRNRETTLDIDPQVKPVAQLYRRVPFNFSNKVEEKIDELIQKDIIESVDCATPWPNPVVIISKKDGDIRLCVDMRQANQAIIRRRYITIDLMGPLPSGHSFG
ncbi:Hypothetical predicted protein [Paramuricea clavata]|uniref:Uncharacterized protein n=1 Tax=Paramuricea clavata TaxID=317549 RepID=A0A6S7JNS4_PARCT|nr:Hypothetical predicted protein [Paramuricea clavata]